MRPKFSGRHVLALHLAVGHLGPVDLELVVGEQRVVLLARLLLDALEVVDRALARLVEQAHLEVGRQLDREHAEVALVVEDHGRVPGGPGRLLVRRKQRVLERGDERAALDALLALDLAYGVNDLLAHPLRPFIDQIGPHDLARTGCPPARRRSAICTALSPAETTSPRARPVSVLTRTGRPTARTKCVTCAERSFESRRGDLDAVAVEVGSQQARHALTERMVDALGVVDEDAKALLAGQLEREHVDAGQRALDQARDLALERLSPFRAACSPS